MLTQIDLGKEAKVTSKTLAPDSLNREADKYCIKHWIEVRKKGVLAINGRWGSGKTWLSDSLLEDFNSQQNYIGVKIDAFSADWSDEPELTIFSEIFASNGFKQLKNHDEIQGNIRKGLIKYSRIAAKIGIQALSNKLLGSDIDIEELVDDSGINNLIEKTLSSAEDKKAGLETIHEAIKGLYKSGKKIVILVDELDRCSPLYAVKLLEKVKHLFDVDGVIVLLVWNEEQMRDSLSHFYGKANANYFQKFVHATHNLFPKSQFNGSKGEITQVINAYFEEFYHSETSRSKKLENSLDQIIAISDLLNLNARESHRYLDLVACWDNQRMESHNMPQKLLEWLLAAILVKNKALIESLKDGKEVAKEEFLDELNKIDADDLRKHFWYEPRIHLLKYLLQLNQGEEFSRDKLPSRQNEWPFDISYLESKTITGESFSRVLQRVAASLFVV